MDKASEAGGGRDPRPRVRGPGYLVVWDAPDGDPLVAERIRRCHIGETAGTREGAGSGDGFAGKDGVRCMAPSVVFVKPSRLAEIRRFLRETGIDHEVDPIVFT